MGAFACNHCDKTFDNKQRLLKHMRTHTGEKPFSCEFCGKCFSEAGNMNRHRKKVHGVSNLFPCSLCNEGFEAYGQLKLHLKLDHGGARPYKCTMCSEGFYSAGVMKRHIDRTHNINNTNKDIQDNQTGETTSLKRRLVQDDNKGDHDVDGKKESDELTSTIVKLLRSNKNETLDNGKAILSTSTNINDETPTNESPLFSNSIDGPPEKMPKKKKQVKLSTSTDINDETPTRESPLFTDTIDGPPEKKLKKKKQLKLCKKKNAVPLYDMILYNDDTGCNETIRTPYLQSKYEKVYVSCSSCFQSFDNEKILKAHERNHLIINMVFERAMSQFIV